KRNSIVKHAINIFLILLGTFIMGSAFNIFYSPNDIILGGFGGIATIISYLIEAGFGIVIPISAIYLVLNALLYFFAAKVLGKRFAIYALVGILSFSLFLEICKFPSISNDLLLSGIYGAVLSGIGVGLVILVGGSTGGDDMLGCVINNKKPNISVGWVTIMINTMVVVVSIFIYGLDKSLYAIIAIFISGKIADFIIEGPKNVKAFYIISKKADEISVAIMQFIERGVTSFDAYGKYSGKRLQVLMCLVNGRQRNELKQIIYDIDPNAFVFSVSVKEAMGNGFMKLEKQKSLLFKKQQYKPAFFNVKSKKYKLIIKNKKDNLKTNTNVRNLKLKD
ncbi:MAG: YitT family protein, partial [Clostridia bacterium]|nr:YitT family protein [Clostridia bacterium]